jgi:cyclohexa-1,5-dienecarbonyl-CoA hydratase
MPEMNATVTRRVEASGAWVRLVLDATPGNVLSMEMVADLRDALAAIGGEHGVKLVTLEGAGEHFSYGASVPEHLPPAVKDMLPAFHGLVRALLDVPAPTAAIVRGRCLGGGLEVALACDLVFAADDAKLGVPEVTLGVFPPAAAALLPARIGAARASRAIITGEALPVSWWSEAGLVTQVSPAARLDADVREWFARHAAPRSAVALSHASRAAREGLRAAALPALAALEQQYLKALIFTHDGLEGCKAFVEKRAPEWRDR